MNKEWEFFELKYKVMETFYDVITDYELSYQEATKVIFDKFFREMSSDGIDKLSIILTIGICLLRKEEISEYYLDYLKKAVNLYSNIDLKKQLKEDEYGVLTYEYECLEYLTKYV